MSQETLFKLKPRKFEIKSEVIDFINIYAKALGLYDGHPEIIQGGGYYRFKQLCTIKGELPKNMQGYTLKDHNYVGFYLFSGIHPNIRQDCLKAANAVRNKYNIT